MSEPASHPYVSRGGEKLAAALDHFQIDVSGVVCADLGSHVGGFVDCLLQRGAAKVYSVDTSYGTLAWKLRRDPRVVVLERTNAMHVSLPEPVNLVTIDVGWTRQAKILPNVAKLLAPSGFVITLIKPQYECPVRRGDQDDSEPEAPAPGDRDGGKGDRRGGTKQRGGDVGSSTGSTRRPDAHTGNSDGQGALYGACGKGTRRTATSQSSSTVLGDETAREVVDYVLRQIADTGWTVVGTVTSPLRGQGGNIEVLARLGRRRDAVDLTGLE
ncbi:MAG: SAM-dependent methyltransferase [Phycisphaerae bacterium]|jgi:predicted rRNA methylase YqxC with S4 and FtsJ domains